MKINLEAAELGEISDIHTKLLRVSTGESRQSQGGAQLFSAGESSCLLPEKRAACVCTLDMTIPYSICILNNTYHIQLYFILYIVLDIHIHHVCHSVLCAISKCFLYFSTHVNFISPASHPTFSAFFVFYPSYCHVIMDVHNWFFNMQSNIGN